MNSNHRTAAPELAVSTWFNTQERPSLAQLRGRVVFLHAFQMLCPACVSHGLPQMQRVQSIFGIPIFRSSACIRCSSITRS